MKSTKRITVLLLCVGLSALFSYAIRQRTPKLTMMCDFGAIYYGARCAMQHRDPYDPGIAANMLRKELTEEGGILPDNPQQAAMTRNILTVETNLPTTLFLFAPLAMLPWAVAQNLWMILIAGLLAFGAFLIWDVGAAAAPDVWLLLAGFLLANCEGLLLDGNSAGFAVGLCVIATWCFLRERYVLIGALLFAVSLLVKPHDSGFIWIYFLFAGDASRKRALQTVAVAGILGLLAAIWIAPVSPHWIQKLHNNLASASVQGSTSDPNLNGTTNSGAGQIIDLQAVLSIFWNNPLFYNLTTYLTVGALMLAWALVTLTRQATIQSAQFALASISALSLLPIYHRSNDAKLLLLAIPACAVLWATKRPGRWIALFLTSASIFLTADMPLAILGELTRNLPSSPSTLPAKLLTILLRRPTPLILLATGCFYLWIFLRHTPPANAPAQKVSVANPMTAEAASWIPDPKCSPRTRNS